MKILNAIYWLAFITIALWVAVSIINVSYANATTADPATWNLFEILYNLAKEK